VIEGQSLKECIKKAQQMALEGKTFIHPFDDPDIIVGQGTMALEILEDLKQTDMIVVPIGGGGIISGIASTVKSIRPEVKVIGVQSSACPSAYESYRSGKITSVDSHHSIADGISVKQVGDLNFDIIRKCVDDVVLVDEDQIAAAILLLLERKKILAEGSARVMRIRVRLTDAPGSLVQLLALISHLKANILHVYHDRRARNLPLYVTRVDLELETRGPEHVEKIAHKLNMAGYEVELR